MTWPAIKLAYPDQWVVMGELDWDEETQEIITAVVLGWGLTRRDANGMAGPPDGGTRAHFYTGRLRSPRPW